MKGLQTTEMQSRTLIETLMPNTCNVPPTLGANFENIKIRQKIFINQHFHLPIINNK